MLGDAALSFAQRLFHGRLSNVEPLATDDRDFGRKLVKKMALEGYRKGK
jgi:hypothetical protein